MTANNSLRIICGLVCVTFTAIVNAAPSPKLPEGFIRCKIYDKDADECMRNAIQVSIPHLANGIPSLGIHKIDPMLISELKIHQSTGPVNIKLSFKDLYIHNIKHAVIDSAHYDPENYTLFMDLHNPKGVELEGDYEISGKVLILPIVGKGKCKINLDLSRVIANVQLKPVVKNGNTHLEIVKLLWKFTATKLVLKFDNLFNGDKALGDNMNLFLNENWRDLLTELQPDIEDVLSVAYAEVGKQFLTRIPLNQIVSE